MHNPNTPNQTTAIHYRAPRPVNIGDVFYTVVRGKNLSFREPCKICDGKRELTVRGFTFKCPACSYEKETINIAPYVVHRWRVYAIEDKVFAEQWKASTDHFTYFKLYRKVGRGYDTWGGNCGNMEIRDDDFTNRYNAPFDGKVIGDYGIYDDYRLAVSVAEQMTALELKRLADYNAEYGTNHEAEWKIEHDPKSD